MCSSTIWFCLYVLKIPTLDDLRQQMEILKLGSTIQANWEISYIINKIHIKWFALVKPTGDWEPRAHEEEPEISPVIGSGRTIKRGHIKDVRSLVCGFWTVRTGVE